MLGLLQLRGECLLSGEFARFDAIDTEDEFLVTY
jgi:hypothetical protein